MFVTKSYRYKHRGEYYDVKSTSHVDAIRQFRELLKVPTELIFMDVRCPDRRNYVPAYYN